jgi:hypothetical protein
VSVSSVPRGLAGAGRAGSLLALLALLALPPAVLAQSPGNPLAPGVPVSPGATPTTTTPTVITAVSSATSGGSGLGGSGAIVIALGAVVVLSGICFYIWRDARRRAPIRHHGPAMTSGREDGRELPGSKRTKPRKLSPAERRRRKRGRARR